MIGTATRASLAGSSRMGTREPGPPGSREFLRRVRHDKEAYFQWQRQYLGWGIFVGRRASF